MNHPECKFVVLKGKEFNNTFYTTNHENPELLVDGTVGFEILGYAKTSEEALRIIYPTKAEENLSVANYIINTYKQYSNLEAKEIIN